MVDGDKTKQDQDQAAEEISLDDIDSILAADDPEFSDSLQDLKEASKEVSEVELEIFDVNEESMAAEPDEESVFDRILAKYPWLNRPLKNLERAQQFIYKRSLIWRNQVKFYSGSLLRMLKSLPQALLQIQRATAVRIREWKRVRAERLKARSLQEKLLMFVFVLGVVGGGFLLALSIDGRWIPQFSKPLLKSFEGVAEQKWTFDYESETVPFLSAFPQPKHNYLFPKVVVNLKTSGSRDSNQMGAFEFFVEVDSKDTAIEIKSREVELHDLIQRTVEGFTYRSLETDLGKQRLKEEIKRELNKTLTQGWVKETYIKFFITKP